MTGFYYWQRFFEFAQHFRVLADNYNMADDFKCRIVSTHDQGTAHVETLSCVTSPDPSAARVVEVNRVIFPPEKLNIIDINAKRRALTSKYHGDKDKILGALSGAFKSQNGGKAADFLAMSDFNDVAVVTGGIYFANSVGNKFWPETGETTTQADGFVWYKPDPTKEGHTLSEQHGNFTSGGYLLVDFQGMPSLHRLNEGSISTKSDLDQYRLAIQSNIILVANGKEDGNSDIGRNAMAALSAQRDGSLSLVTAAEPGKPSNRHGITSKEFGQLLVGLGSRYAINLDGGPSTQFAVRKMNCQNVGNSNSCVEDLIHHSDTTNPMPQVFSVSK